MTGTKVVSTYNMRERKPKEASAPTFKPPTHKKATSKKVAPKKIPSKKVPSKNAAPNEVTAQDAVSITNFTSLTEDQKVGPKRKRIRGERDPPPSPVFNPTINGLRPPESDDGDDGPARPKKRKVSTSQNITIAKSVAADRNIPEGQGVDYDITVGCKYQAEPCSQTPHISEERLQEIFDKIRKNIKKGVTEQTINIRPWNYLIPTKAQITRRKRQGVPLYTEIGVTEETSAKTKTTPALNAPALIALERKRRIAKQKSTRASAASRASETTKAKVDPTPPNSQHEEEGEEEEKIIPPPLSVYDPYWSIQNEEAEEEDEDYVPPSRSNCRLLLNTQRIVQGVELLSSPPVHIPSRTQLRVPGSPSTEDQANSPEVQPSAVTEHSSQAQVASIGKDFREKRPVIDYLYATKVGESSSCASTELYGIENSKSILPPVKVMGPPPRPPMGGSSSSTQKYSFSVGAMGPPPRPPMSESSSSAQEYSFSVGAMGPPPRPPMSESSSSVQEYSSSVGAMGPPPRPPMGGSSSSTQKYSFSVGAMGPPPRPPMSESSSSAQEYSSSVGAMGPPRPPMGGSSSSAQKYSFSVGAMDPPPRPFASGSSSSTRTSVKAMDPPLCPPMPRSSSPVRSDIFSQSSSCTQSHSFQDGTSAPTTSPSGFPVVLPASFPSPARRHSTRAATKKKKNKDNAYYHVHEEETYLLRKFSDGHRMSLTHTIYTSNAEYSCLKESLGIIKRKSGRTMENHPLGSLPRTRPTPPRTNNPTINYWRSIVQIGEPSKPTPKLGPPRPVLKLVIPTERQFNGGEVPEPDEYEKNPEKWGDLVW